jgi:hypothetical protein
MALRAGVNRLAVCKRRPASRVARFFYWPVLRTLHQFIAQLISSIRTS